MGSKKHNFKNQQLVTHLNAGNGYPWAGQDSPMEVSIWWTKRSALVTKENFGLAPPMGSKNGVYFERWNK